MLPSQETISGQNLLFKNGWKYQETFVQNAEAATGGVLLKNVF